MEFEKLTKAIDSYADKITCLERDLVAIPALSPEYEEPSDYTGELRKVIYLEKYLKNHGIDDLKRIDAPDDRLEEKIRPSLIAKIPGHSNDRTIWIMAHTDVVPPGDLSKWDSDPYKLEVKGDLMYGRGTEDNHQGLVAGVIASLAFLETGIKPAYDIGLLFIADEECGSEYGIHYLLKNDNPFHKEDIIIVPDGGAKNGSEIETAEKGILWKKFTVTGKSCHGSMPDTGINAHRAGAHLIVALERLKEIFDKKDPLFIPQACTFEPTKKEANVPNINTIAGEDIFYFDCRILPGYSLEEVDREINSICKEISEKFNVKISSSDKQREEASPKTSSWAPVVSIIQTAVKSVYNVEARTVGIGGGTVAAPLRRLGLPCVVWAKMDETMHGPNEYARISNIQGDAKVFCHVALQK